MSLRKARNCLVSTLKDDLNWLGLSGANEQQFAGDLLVQKVRCEDQLMDQEAKI